MKYRLFTLPAILVVSLASVYLLPQAGDMAKSAIRMELPETSGGWLLRPQQPSQVEIETLAKDTEFSKAMCLRAREGEVDIASGLAVPDRVDLSIVLSGHDLNNSIHRPERCMPSQGHVITSSSDVELELSHGKKFAVKRLLSVQSIPTNEEHTEHVKYNCVTYYFFVGNRHITQGHYKRTLLDMQDRLLFGMDQRWAYISASMWYGKVPWIAVEVTMEEADAKLKAFLVEFGETQIDWGMLEM